MNISQNYENYDILFEGSNNSNYTNHSDALLKHIVITKEKFTFGIIIIKCVTFAPVLLYKLWNEAWIKNNKKILSNQDTAFIHEKLKSIS